MTGLMAVPRLSLWIRTRDGAPREVYALKWTMSAGKSRETVLTARPDPPQRPGGEWELFESREKDEVELAAFLRSHERIPPELEDDFRPPYQLSIHDEAKKRLDRLYRQRKLDDQTSELLREIAYRR